MSRIFFKKAAVGLVAGLFLAFGGLVLWTRYLPHPLRPLRAGAETAPPYLMVQPGGAVTGFAVDVLNEAARRHGWELDWVPVKGGADRALLEGDVDLWPMLGDTPGRRERLHLSDYWLRSEAWLLTLESGGIESLDAMAGRTVGFPDLPIFQEVAARAFPRARRLPLNRGRDQLLEAVCSGEASGLLMEFWTGIDYLAHRPAECRSANFRLIPVRQNAFNVSVGSTFPYAGYADALRDEIGRMSQDGTLSKLFARWRLAGGNETAALDERFETRRRGTMYAVAVAALLLMMIALLYQTHRLRAARAMARSVLERIESVG
jgi:cystine transport system substrate-binding protein